MKKVTAKRKGTGLEVKTFRSTDGKTTYTVHKTPGKPRESSYYVTMEVEAKEAAKDCGSKLPNSENTRTHWAKLWKS